MAAYAALLSLNFTIELHHQRSIVYPARYPIQSVKQTITFLVKIFQDYDHQTCSEEIVELEREIAEAAYDVDYVIECLALDPVLVKSGYKAKHSYSSKLFSEDEMMQIMKKLVFLREKAMKILDVKVTSEGDQLPTTTSLTYSNTAIVSDRMVGFDDHLAEVDNRIFDGTYNLQILPIVGIGGIGKTTLIRNFFEDQKQYFDILIWCTISQSPDIQSVLSSFLQDLGIVDDGQTDPGEQLRRRLYHKKYLIVLDDIWGIDVWDMIKSFFPDDRNYSLIIVTTRLLSVASYIGTCEPYELPFLNEDASWDLLRERVFAEDICPPELEHIGMQIARGCRGLPLVIVVIAGQLSNNMTRDSWESVAVRLRSVVDSEGEEWCLQILSYCYESLPVHLKPCFLYMGVFPEDHSTEVSLLINMWVAEGFLKPNGDQCLEAVAMEFVMDLVQRNLFMVTERSSTGKIKYFQIHDLLRDLCLNKAHEYNFLRSRTYFNLGILPGAERDYPLYILPARERLIISPFEQASKSGFSANKNLMHFRLRCIRLSAAKVMDILIFSACLASLSMFQNLQSIIMKSIPGEEPVFLPPQIWEMPLLKHIEIQRVVLPNPPDVDSHDSEEVHCVLKNMQTLLNVYSFKFSEEVCKMFPNLKKLKTFTKRYEYAESPVYGKISAVHISFLQSLRSLRLDCSMIPWEDMAKVGSLPNLEKLSLWNDAFCGSEWRTIEGQFCKLKSLHLGCLTLVQWEAKSSHFPVLEQLTFYNIQRLNEIPKEIGYIQTLRFVSLEYCPESLADSARSLNYRLRVHVSNLLNIPLMVQRVLSNDPETQVEATTQLRKLLFLQGSPRMGEVIRSGVIPRLVEFLGRHDLPQLQFEAAWALTNVASASGTSDHTRNFIEQGVVPVFVQFLSSSNDAACKQAVSSLGNVAADSPSCRDLVLGHGALMPLLTQLYDHSKLSMLRIASWTLSKFCGGTPSPPFVQVRLSLPVLGQLIDLNDEEVLTNACRSLAYLSNGTKDRSHRTQSVIEAGICPRLIKLLLHPSPTILEPALQTVGSIVTGDDVQKQCVIDNHALPCLYQLLTQNHEKSIKWEACRTIANITAGNRAQIQAVIEADIILPLVRLIQDADFDIMKQALQAISNASSGGSQEQIRFLVSQGCIQLLCDLLSCPDPIIITVCIKVLNNILKAGEADNETGSNSRMNIYDCICDGLTKIENILENRDQNLVDD